MRAEVSASVLLSNKSLQNNGTLCCAASDARRALLTQSDYLISSPSYHAPRTKRYGWAVLCTVVGVHDDLRMKGLMLRFQTPKPKVPRQRCP
jgi:hypothetical protein